MTVTTVSPSTTTQTQAANTARTTLSSNFDTFLTLLTAQLSNQDPLNPVDSAQFTQQLVQYSQVEQQIQTNERLQSLLSQSSAASGAASVAYIGRTAVLESETTSLKNGSAAWSYATPSAVGEVTLSVRDAAGREVFKTVRPAANGASAFEWNGKDAAGRSQPEGAYTLAISAKDSTGKSVTPAVNVNEQITGIDFSGTDPLVMTASGQRPFKSILTIRN